MPLDWLDHYTIRAQDLQTTRDFYVRVLGLAEGHRPQFDFPGHWLYCGERAVVHLVGVDPLDKDGLRRFLGDRQPAHSTGGGAVDHVAFRATDLHATRERLKTQGVAFRERTIPDLDLHLLFIADPDGVTIELNYSAGEALATNHA